jgi:hypothetical protein
MNVQGKLDDFVLLNFTDLFSNFGQISPQSILANQLESSLLYQSFSSKCFSAID